MLEFIKGSPLAAFAVAFITTLLVTPLVKVLAWRCGAVAHPDARRLHLQPIAMWGGLGLFIGVVAAALVWRQPGWQDIRLLAPSRATHDIAATAQSLRLSTVFLGCGFLVLLLGMIDDRVELSPAWKFAGQILIAALLWYGGVRIRSLPFTSGTHELQPAISLMLTIFWVVGITNAVNLIDGMDGLATGVCAIASASLSLILMRTANWAAAVSAAMCGACLGFLRFNFHPAKIYLGDAGSTLLGFWFAVIAIAANSKAAAATTLVVPVLVMGVPLFDTAWAIVRRSLARQPWWRADRGHLHHRLQAKGLSTVKTVLVLYLVSLALGISVMIWTFGHP